MKPIKTPDLCYPCLSPGEGKSQLHLKTIIKSATQQCAKYIKFIVTLLEKNVMK